MSVNNLPFEEHLNELESKITELRTLSETHYIDLSEEIETLTRKLETSRKKTFSSLSAWETTQIARHSKRPFTLDYINSLFEDFVELHGGRQFPDDNSIVGGFAKFRGQSVVVVGHQKGKDTNDNLYRNFGMPHPEGYRKAMRIMNLGNKFGKPIVCFIDTPGAYPGIGAEERGQAEAIARNIFEMSFLGVPVICIVIGEGGSGGAVALGVGDRVLMLENAIYSVISPEGCASILWKDASKMQDAALALKITAQDLLKLEVIDEIIAEPLGGAHRDTELMSKNVGDAIEKHLGELRKYSAEDLVRLRQDKYRKMGVFKEG